MAEADAAVEAQPNTARKAEAMELAPIASDTIERLRDALERAMHAQ